MKTITVELPDMVDVTEKEAKSMLAARLYEKGTLSLGQAAEMAGYSKVAFMEIIGDYGVSIFNYPVEDILKDAANAASYHIRH